MPRPKSDDKRFAILSAATRVIVAQGLSAPTAGIAKEAGVANGSLFTYFSTKAALFNQLYLELKGEMATVAARDLEIDSDLREQSFAMWINWTNWALSYPDKRKALSQLAVSDEITAETRSIGHKLMAPVAGMIENCRAGGSLQDAPMPFVVALMNSVAEATMDFMAQDPANREAHCRTGFEAFWRLLQ